MTKDELFSAYWDIRWPNTTKNKALLETSANYRNTKDAFMAGIGSSGSVECETCGNDPVVASIAKLMGFRPDVAFLRIKELERFVKNGIEQGFISIPEEPDPARKIIDEILNR